MRKIPFLFIIAAGVFMASAGGQPMLGFDLMTAHAHSGATGIVKDRMDRFKESQQALKAIAKAIKTEDYDAILAPAETIAQWGDEMVSYFPEGSNPSPSEALDVIWQEMDQFNAMASANAKAVRRLQRLVREGDHARIKPAFNEVVGSCKSCHQKFRQ